MKELITPVLFALFMLSCKSKQKIAYQDKDNPVINTAKKYDTIYIEDANGNLKMRIAEIK